MRKRRLSLGVRLTLVVALGGLLTLTLTTAYYHKAAQDILVEELEAKAIYLSVSTASRIETVERAAEKVAEELAVVLGEVEQVRPTLFSLLSATVEAHTEIFGSAIAFRPEFLPEDADYAAPYVFRGPDGHLAELDLAQGSYAYETGDWYQFPLVLGRPVWSEPYFDEGGGDILMVTYSVPFRTERSGEAFAGVITADLSLAWLTDYLTSLGLEGSDFAFLLSRHGRVISHPNAEFIMNESIFSLAEARADSTLRAIGRRMISHDQDFVRFTALNGVAGWLAYTPVPTTEWTLGVFFTEEQVMAKIRDLTRNVILIGVGGSILLVLVIIGSVKRISGPIRQLTDAAITMSTGNLDVALPSYSGGDEIEELSGAFSKMRDDLKTHIAGELEKKRMEGQLQVARTIQQGLMPAVVPETPGLEVAGDSIYCLEIAGDYYDIIPMEGGRTALVLGDVSGKGAGAALIMANVQAALRTIIETDQPLSEIVARVNDVVEHNTPSGDFITFFVAIHDPTTRRLTYVNAGHNPPFVLYADGRVVELTEGGLVLAAMAGFPYQEETLPFEVGDTLFTYSDGLSEAMNAEQEEFGEERVKEFFVANSGTDPAEFLRLIHEEAIRFGGRDTFEDDFTMLFARGVPMAEDQERGEKA